MTTARARRTDPPTSHEAAARVTASAAAATQAGLVLALLRHYPGKTSAELAVMSRVDPTTLIILDRSEVARRLPELTEDCLAEKGEIRVCGVSGKRAVTWWPVEPLTQARLL